jgi:protein CpxP
MSKSKLLTFAVITLIIINIITLSFFIFKGPKEKGQRNGRGPVHSPKYIVVDKLHFDEEQVTKYQEFIKQHSEAISTIDNKIFVLKNSLYKELLNPKNKNVSDSLFSQIDYNALTIELAQIFGPKLPPKHNNRELHQ